MGAGQKPSATGPAGASLSDVLTLARQITQAINNLAQTYLSVQGNQNKLAISTTTLVMSGQGRVARVSVLAAGSASGALYDSTNTSATSAPIWTIPQTVGTYDVNFPLAYGLVVAPGTSQVVSVSYSSAP